MGIKIGREMLLAANLLGDAVRDALDPRLSARPTDLIPHTF